jgi:hypothetical protein
MNVVRDRARLHAFINLNGLPRRIADNPAIRTFREVPLELVPKFRLCLLVQVIAELR